MPSVAPFEPPPVIYTPNQGMLLRAHKSRAAILAQTEEAPMEQELYRVKDFCRLYALSHATFYREVAAKKLTIIKRGRSTLVRKEEATRWLRQLEAEDRR